MTLHIREVTQNMASNFLNEVQQIIVEIKAKGWDASRMVKLQSRLIDLFNEKGYEEMLPITEEIKAQHQFALQSDEKLTLMKKAMGEAEDNGLGIPKTINLVTLAEQSFARGEFHKASARGADA